MSKSTRRGRSGHLGGLGWMCAAVAVLAAATPALAGGRVFTYVYEATTMPAGEWEYEQWVTWKTDKDDDATFDRIDVRHEIEVGITDNLQLAVYVSDWRYEDGKSVADDGADWRNVAVEVIYALSDPTADAIGSALYGEIKFGDELFELEGKLLLQKNIDRFIIAYNATIEAEWEGSDYSEDKGELAQSFGVSYEISPTWNVGAELLHEVEIDDWSKAGDNVVYIGPNVSYSAKSWWVTITPLFQITDVGSEPNFQTRLLFGISF